VSALISLYMYVRECVYLLMLGELKLCPSDFASCFLAKMFGACHHAGMKYKMKWLEVSCCLIPVQQPLFTKFLFTSW